MAYVCVFSLSQEFLLEVFVECIFVEVANGQRRVGVEDDAVFVDLADFLEIDDIGAMDAHEEGGGQVGGH